MQYLKQAGTPLLDEDQTVIIAEDVATGEKELTLTMLWNMFVHLQIPLLINKTFLSEEICKIKGAEEDCTNCNSFSHLEILLKWIQAISRNYGLNIENSASLVDGKAMWCLIDYYFRSELSCSCCKAQDINGKDQNLWDANCSDAVHNFILSQKLAMVLGNFPEVLQIADILENNGACNEQSVIILLVFLSSQLIGRKDTGQLNIQKLLGCNCRSPDLRRFSLHKCFLNSDLPMNHNRSDEDCGEGSMRSFKVIQAWWRDMAKRHHNCENKRTAVVQLFKAGDHGTHRERAVKTIQSHFRGSIERRHFLKIKATSSFLQNVIRAWLNVKITRVANKFSFSISKELSLECREHPDRFGRYLLFMVQRHSFVMLKKSVLLIQKAARVWIKRRNSKNKSCLECPVDSNQIAAAIIIQSYIRRWRAMRSFVHMVLQLRRSEHIRKEEEVKNIQIEAALKIQLAWRRFSLHNFIYRKWISAAKIQSHWRGCLMRRNYILQKNAAIKIQCVLRCLKCSKDFQQYKVATRSAILIQSHVRGLISRREAERQRHFILLIQSHWRVWLTRRDFLYKREAAITIQSGLRCLSCCKSFHRHRHAAIEIQRFARGQAARNRLLGASICRSAFRSDCMDQIARRGIVNFELKILLYSVMKLQRWWRRVLLLNAKTRSAIIIQSHVRAWIARREIIKTKQRIVVIQSYCKGYIARKESRGQLLDLRLRLQKSAANVDDGMRLINRLVAALSELLSNRSVRSVLHTCATLDMATKHSQKCCETLVAAGATGTLLKLIRSVTRSIPDQEVLKHALSTLRNLSRYPHLADVLIDTNGSAEIILWEFLRNKKEGYFIASELLKKLCKTKKGLEAVQNLPAYFKRLQSLVDDLTKKVNAEKRKTSQLSRKEDTESRLKEAVELLRLITNG